MVIEPDQSREEAVLRRMLDTLPKLHKSPKSKQKDKLHALSPK
jgi:hypothetical protein